MRNLKKFLALVLAMMMVLGLMVTANATGYTDDSSIDSRYREAVEVLSAIGMLEGDNGYVNPEGNIRRAEFSIMLYRMATGDVKGTKPALNAMEEYDQFSDVISGDNRNFGWAAKYVNYAADAGWFEGDSGIGSTFRPGDNVTYYQVLVCMLRVLGLADDCTGPDWEFKTAVKATKLGLEAGIDSLVANEGSATRQEVAQIVLNTLLYTTENTYNWIVYIDDGAYDEASPSEAAGNHKYDPNKDTVIYDGPDYDEAMLYAQSTGALVHRELSTAGSLADINFNGLHRLSGGGRDDYGRPTVKWVYGNGGKVVEFPRDADFHYDGTMTGKNAKALGRDSRKNDATTKVWYNGNEITSGYIQYQFAENDATTGGILNGLWLSDSAGIPGYEIFIYNNGNYSYDVIVREAYLAQVTNINSKTGNITLTVYDRATAATSGDIVSKGDLTAKAATASSDADDFYEELAGYEKGDYLAVYAYMGWNDGDSNNVEDCIIEIAPLTSVVSTTITQIDDTGENVSSILTTKNGVFKVNNGAMWIKDVDHAKSSIYLPGFNNVGGDGRNIKTGTATLYLLGESVLLIDQSTAEDKADTGYAYLFDTRVTTNNTWKTQEGAPIYEAMLYLEDGEKHTVRVAYYTATDFETPYSVQNAANKTPTDDGEAFDVSKEATGGQTGGGIFVYYEVAEDSDGNEYYKLAIADQNGDDRSITDENDSTPSELLIVKNVANGTIPGTTSTPGSVNVVFDKATVFYVVTGDPTEETVKVYKGIHNVPSMASAAGEGTPGEEGYDHGTAVAVATRDVDGYTVVTAIMIKNPGDGSQNLDDTYFVVGADKATHVTVTVDKVTYTYYRYNAVVGGKITTVLVSKKLDDASAELRVFAKSSVKLDPNAAKVNKDVIVIPEATSQYIDSGDFKEITGTVSKKDLKNGVLIVDTDATGKNQSYLVDDDLVMFLYDTNKGTVEDLTIDDVTNTMKGYYVLTGTGSQTVVSALYLYETDN